MKRILVVGIPRISAGSSSLAEYLHNRGLIGHHRPVAGSPEEFAGVLAVFQPEAVIFAEASDPAQKELRRTLTGLVGEVTPMLLFGSVHWEGHADLRASNKFFSSVPIFNESVEEWIKFVLTKPAE